MINSDRDLFCAGWSRTLATCSTSCRWNGNNDQLNVVTEIDLDEATRDDPRGSVSRSRTRRFSSG